MTQYTTVTSDTAGTEYWAEWDGERTAPVRTWTKPMNPNELTTSSAGNGSHVERLTMRYVALVGMRPLDWRVTDVKLTGEELEYVLSRLNAQEEELARLRHELEIKGGALEQLRQDIQDAGNSDGVLW